jgi:molybdate transport system substrate-binding protein
MYKLAITLLVLLTAIGCTKRQSPPLHNPTAPKVTIFTGPNMRISLETLAKMFEERTGTHVDVVADDVRPLIAKLQAERAAGRGPDLFCTHDPFMQVAIKTDVPLIEAWSVASLVPMIVVPKGNPQQIAGLADLARPGLRVGVSDAEQTISGEIIKVMLARAKIADDVRKNVVVRTSQGRDLCKALLAGQCDVGIVWNAVVHGNKDKVEAIAIDAASRPERGVDAEIVSPTLGRLELDHVRVGVALLKDAPNAALAKKFVELVNSPEGAAVFAANGFSAADPARQPDLRRE